jgi:predicted dehydrogenase
MHTSRLSRREFLRNSTLAAGAFYISRRGFAQSPNSKLNIGVIGVANRAGENLKAVAGENIAAICDVDENFLNRAAMEFPQAKRYQDFRKMIEQGGLDAVVVSTTDHTHAVATVAALRSGLHVYCEKPLTHTVSEARIVRETARKEKRVTQMGTQIHAGSNYRRVVELVRSGAIGPVREVHNWVGSVWSGHNQPADSAPVPAHLNWDMWLGPAAERPYSPAYHPARWRGYWAFGGGAMSDMACHHMDLPFWALDLGQPTSVEAEGPELHPEFAPVWLIAHYNFPARADKPPVKLTWYNGDKRPELLKEEKFKSWGGGTLFVGDKGMLLADYGRHVLLPDEKFADFQRPAPSIPESIGHHAEWIKACKDGGTPTCNFEYAGVLTEAVLLANVSFRTGKKIEWDPKNLRAKNAPEAERYIQHHYRKGWKI